MKKNKFYEVHLSGEGFFDIYHVSAPNAKEAKKRAWGKFINRKILKKNYWLHSDMVHDPNQQ